MSPIVSTILSYLIYAIIVCLGLTVCIVNLKIYHEAGILSKILDFTDEYPNEKKLFFDNKHYSNITDYINDVLKVEGYLVCLTAAFVLFVFLVEHFGLNEMARLILTISATIVGLMNMVVHYYFKGLASINVLHLHENVSKRFTDLETVSKLGLFINITVVAFITGYYPLAWKIIHG